MEVNVGSVISCSGEDVSRNAPSMVTSPAIIEAAKEGLLKGQATPLAFPQVENNGHHPQVDEAFRDSPK